MGYGEPPVWLWIFPAVGAILLLVLIISLIRRVQFMQTAEITDGVIVGYEARSVRTKNGHSTVYHPVLRFRSRDGSEEEHTSSFGSSWRRGREGDVVEVFYQPDNPKGFKLRAGVAVYLSYTIVAVIALAFLVIGFLLLR